MPTLYINLLDKVGEDDEKNFQNKNLIVYFCLTTCELAHS